MRHLCTRVVVCHINRWEWDGSFRTTLNKHGGEQVDSDALRDDLTRLILEHCAGFGPASCPLTENYYQLSEEDDAMKRGACYVHYFAK